MRFPAFFDECSPFHSLFYALQHLFRILESSCCCFIFLFPNFFYILACPGIINVTDQKTSGDFFQYFNLLLSHKHCASPWTFWAKFFCSPTAVKLWSNTPQFWTGSQTLQCFHGAHNMGCLQMLTNVLSMALRLKLMATDTFFQQVTAMAAKLGLSAVSRNICEKGVSQGVKFDRQS